jgi:hypothetical protein
MAMPASNHIQELDNRVIEAMNELAFALGLVRVLTLLPLHDPALGAVETRIANAYSELLGARREFEEPS